MLAFANSLRWPAAFAAGVAVIAMPQASLAGSNRGAAEVLAREHQYSEAILHGDARSLASVFADTFVDTSESGLLRDKQQMLAVIARQPPPTSLTESQRRIQMYGDAAVVTVRFDVKGVYAGKAYESVGRATDVWVRMHGTWYCVAAHSSAVQPDSG